MKPRTLAELHWRIDRVGWIYWNGNDRDRFEQFIAPRFDVRAQFCVTPGPLPLRFPYAEDQRSGRSREINARHRISRAILYAAISADRAFTSAQYPESTPSDDDLEILHTATLLHLEFADDFWCRLKRSAKSQTFSADAVCDWIEQRTERWLSDSGQWPHWAHLPEPLAVAA